MYRQIVKFTNRIALIIIAITIHANQALSKNYVVIKQVSSAVFDYKMDSLYLTVSYPSGGCDPNERSPRILLDLISIKDSTTEFARETGIVQYDVKVKAKVTEVPLKRSQICAMGYTITITEDLNKLFTSEAEKFGIDLRAKNSQYSVSFQLDSEVVSNASFATFEN